MALRGLPGAPLARVEETLFVLMILGDDRTVRATYIAGELAHAREPVDA